MPKIIKYYVKSQYGQNREYIHSDHKADAESIGILTGQKTLNSKIRDEIEKLTDNSILFQEVIGPK